MRFLKMGRLGLASKHMMVCDSTVRPVTWLLWCSLMLKVGGA